MASSEMKRKLRAAKKGWAAAKTRAKEERSGFAEYDDGRYIAKLTDCFTGESNSSGRFQITWEWTFMEGEYEGETKRDFDGLETEDNLMWVARKIAKLGFEVPDDFDDLDEVLKEIVSSGIIAKIRLKSKGEYQNLYVDKVLDTDIGADDDDDDEEDETPEKTAKPARGKKKPEPEPEPEEDDEEEDDEEEDDEEEDDEEEDDVPEEPAPKRKKKRK